MLREGELLTHYRDSTDASAGDALHFIYKHRHQIVKDFGYNTLKEMTLNYRTYFRKEQKGKIINDYCKYVISKQVHHKSDLAIGHNIVKYVVVNPEAEAIVIDFMFSMLKDTLAQKYKNLDILSSKYFMKKHLVIEYIDKHVLTKRII